MHLSQFSNFVYKINIFWQKKYILSEYSGHVCDINNYYKLFATHFFTKFRAKRFDGILFCAQGVMIIASLMFCFATFFSILVHHSRPRTRAVGTGGEGGGARGSITPHPPRFREVRTQLLFSFETFDSFMVRPGRNQVYGACCSAQTACKPVLTSSTMQATDTKILLFQCIYCG